jgi:hypothetical protein
MSIWPYFDSDELIILFKVRPFLFTFPDQNLYAFTIYGMLSVLCTAYNILNYKTNTTDI